MIGVIATAAEERVAREFFELFKTPWEFCQAGCSYDVVLSSGSASKAAGVKAKLILVYAGGKADVDEVLNVQIDSYHKGAKLSVFGRRLPIYGSTVTLKQGATVLTEYRSGGPVVSTHRVDETVFARVGYDLFQEVQTLLAQGQPFENAAVPTLDLHIEFLRCLITCNGIPLLEIPPVPAGFPFIACLTHDSDHASIRRHRFDPTIFGFLYRSIVGSVINVARGRSPMKKLFANWVAAAKLPFIYLGLTKDIWLEFDRYIELEGGRPSTFFFVPKESYPGRTRNGNAPPARGTRYNVSHVAEKIPRLMAAGCEIGLHGIDAWLESSKGREEAGRVSEVSAKPVAGVRMHWLYADEKTADVLDEAGFSYDSTVGYNDTCGYRAGTAQVFKPAQASRLLELPMLIMDTALFYPHYLDLSETDALERLTHLFDDVLYHGGVLTVNWHDRSIAPERLWGDFYVRVINELTSRGAWFSTAEQAVSWFRRRRSATFERVAYDNERFRITVAGEDGTANLPGFRLRFHRPRTWPGPGLGDTSVRDRYTDTVFAGGIDFRLPN